MRITQGYGVGTHRGTYALDDAGQDTGIETAYAPFDGVIKKIWANGNTVWLESLQPVEYADATIDYATVSMTHDNDISNLRVGQTVKQNAPFYQEGTAGNATGNHVHLECAKGKFTGTGWNQNSYGYWVINNPYKPHMMFWVDGKIINGGGLNWKSTTGGTSMAKDTTIQRVFEMGLSRKADSGALTTYRQTTDEVLVNSVYTSTERASKLKDLKISGGSWVARISNLMTSEATLTAKVNSLTATVTDQNKKIVDYDKQLTELKDMNSTQQTTISQLQDENNRLKKELEDCDDGKGCKVVQSMGWIQIIKCKIQG